MNSIQTDFQASKRLLTGGTRLENGAHGIMCQYWACHSIEEPSAMKFKRIAVETSKSVFTLHGVDEQGRPTLRQNLSRAQFRKFVGKASPTEVVLEACGSP